MTRPGAQTLTDEHVVAAMNILSRAIEKLDEGGIDVRNYILDARNQLAQTMDPFVAILGAHIVVIPTLAWQPTGDEDPTSRLSGPQLVIASTPMHLEAWAVKRDDEGNYVGDGDFPEMPEALNNAVDPNEPLQTTEIADREYVIVAFPHS